jgi:hypothetical protein
MGEIKDIYNSSRSRRVEFFQNLSGLVSFEESEAAMLDNPNLEPEERAYWKHVRGSGLYEGLAAAEAAARAEIPWLRERLT